MTLGRIFRVLLVGFALLTLAACGGEPGGAGGGAVIAELEPLPPEDDARSAMP